MAHIDDGARTMTNLLFSTNQRRRSIAKMLREGQTIRGFVMQELFGVSEATVIRDIRFLRSRGMPIVGIAGHGYILEAGTGEAILGVFGYGKEPIDKQSLPWYAINMTREAA